MKKLSAIIFLLSFAIVQLFVFENVSAAGCEFFLSDVQAQKGRLVTVNLECASDREVCAFVAKISYDAKALEYRSAKVCASDAQHSVNASEEGRLTLVYLREDGATCTDKTPLLEIKFKALQEGEHKLTLDVEQVIDSTAETIVVSNEKGACVNIDTPSQGASDKSNVHKSQEIHGTQGVETQTTANSETQNITAVNFSQVSSSGIDIPLVVLSAAVLLVLLGMVGFVAYKWGVRRSGKEQIPVLDLSEEKQ